MSARRALREADRIRAMFDDIPAPGEAAGPLSARDEAILARILSSEPGAASSGGGLPRARRTVTVRRVVLAAVTVIALVVGGLSWQAWRAVPADALTPAVLPFSDGSVADALAAQGQPAREALLRLAEAAGSQPSASGAGDQVVSSYGWYLNASVDADGVATTVLAPMFSTTVLRPDGSFSNREIRAPALDVHGRVVDGEYPPGGQTSGDDLPAGTFDPAYVANLPRDPAALRQALLGPVTGLDASVETGVLVQLVTGLYAQYVVPPDLAAAVWTMLADEPGLISLGTSQDRLGRDGVAVAVRDGQPEAPALTVLVISEEDGRLLGWEHMVDALPDLGIEEPAVTAFQAFLSAEWASGR